YSLIIPKDGLERPLETPNFCASTLMRVVFPAPRSPSKIKTRESLYFSRIFSANNGNSASELITTSIVVVKYRKIIGWSNWNFQNQRKDNICRRGCLPLPD